MWEFLEPTILVCRLKFLKETLVVLREHTKVAYLIFQVCNALYTETEGIATILLRVDAAKLQDVRVNHSATKDFHPASVLTESTAYTTANMA